MLGAKKHSSATEALKKLELIPLDQKREIHLAVHVKKSLEGHTSDNIKNLYQSQVNNNITRAGTRGDLTYPKHKLEQYSKGPFYSSIKTWNSLPPNLRDNNLNNFKTELQKHFVKKFTEN